MRYQTKAGKIFDTANIIFLIILCFITIYPFIYVLACSFSDAVYVEGGDVLLWPVSFTTDAYREAFKNEYVWTGYLNSIIYTVSFTALEIVSVYCIAYPLSKKRLIFKNFFLWYFLIRMFLPGGLIPNYLVISSLGLVNTRLAMVIPGLAKIWDILLVRNYLNTIPGSLEESALIDGANEIQILFRIMLPLSLPILATIALFNAVDKWNEYMNALIYLQDSAMHPIQVVLQRLLIASQTMDTEQSTALTYYQGNKASISTLKHAVTIISILPIVMVYPFLQKYFVKGIIVGAIKE